jgi:outer membrane protein OmpA-like peptidoglycan-associated protein
MQSSDQRCGISLMWSAKQRLRGVGRLTGTLSMLLLLSFPARAQTAAPPENLVEQLSGLETAPDIDLAALRQQALERIKSRTDAAPLMRPPIAAQLLQLPQSSFEIQFDTDSPIVRPPSYRTLGRIADALTQLTLLPYKFLVVDHTNSIGRRDANLTLSQRRANAIRDVLLATFKISPKRIEAVGLGEEQLQDSAHPTAATNLRVQIVTIGKAAER